MVGSSINGCFEPGILDYNTPFERRMIEGSFGAHLSEDLVDRDLKAIAKILGHFTGKLLEKTSLLFVGPGPETENLARNFLKQDIPDERILSKHLKAHEGGIGDLQLTAYTATTLEPVDSDGKQLSRSDLCARYSVQVVVICTRITESGKLDRSIAKILQNALALNLPTVIALTLAESFSQQQQGKYGSSRQQDKVDFSKRVTTWKSQILAMCMKKEDRNVPTSTLFAAILPTTNTSDGVLPTGSKWLPSFQLAVLKCISPQVKGNVSYPYMSDNWEELSLQPGDMVTNIQWYKDGLWALGTCQGKMGMFHPLLLQAIDPKAEELKCRKRDELKQRDPPKGTKEHFKGIAYNFLAEHEEDDKCMICFELANKPVQTKCCGKTFCQACFEKIQNNHCPNCREEDNFESYEDQKTARRITSYTIVCVNYESGCDWEGELGSINDHLRKQCFFEVEECQRNCGQQYKRYLKYLHAVECPLRELACPFCSSYPETSIEMTYRHLVLQHWKECSHWPAQCPNLCDERHLERGTVQSHLNHDCLKQRTFCKYHEFGCNYAALREDIGRHEEDQEMLKVHMDMMERKYRQSVAEVYELRGKIAVLECTVHRLQDSQTVSGSTEDT